MILSHRRYERVNAVDRIVHRTFAAPPQNNAIFGETVAQLLARVPCFGTVQMMRTTTQHHAYEAFAIQAAVACPCAGTVQRLPRNAGRAMIWIYRHTLSPLVGYNCRHLPTCSVYGDEAIERFGLWAGGWMTLARLLRCQPWGTSGIDNVPLTKTRRARAGICRGGSGAGAASTRPETDAARLCCNAFRRNAHCCPREPALRRVIGSMSSREDINDALENSTTGVTIPARSICWPHLPSSLSSSRPADISAKGPPPRHRKLHRAKPKRSLVIPNAVGWTAMRPRQERWDQELRSKYY
jgi:putative membrane protein insertion efficiency factor